MKLDDFFKRHHSCGDCHLIMTRQEETSLSVFSDLVHLSDVRWNINGLSRRVHRLINGWIVGVCEHTGVLDIWCPDCISKYTKDK